MPIIYDDSIGAVVSDSAVIAAYLDKAYPSSGPVLIPTGTKALQLAFSSAVIDAFAAFRPFFPFDTEKDGRSDDGFFQGQENFAFVICVLAFTCVHLRFICDHLRSHQIVYDIINAC
ncbi:hypothetical protein ARMSODRAFT_515872 [Armillaria solidipes]|uniref:GST N-terminal domain-containing protein n=1 Tax=Armillaria solidipes TaxID=1076256 RepID=A0A2H3AZA3_9AGAR|nr:hypothetical protein ARMSODRAFT_515872 [Armillaria solidipes]